MDYKRYGTNDKNVKMPSANRYQIPNNALGKNFTFKSDDISNPNTEQNVDITISNYSSKSKKY